MTLPTYMKACITEGAKGVMRSVLLPKYRPNEVLVKNLAVAINPTDWKHIDNKFGREGNVVGSDLAGEVVAVGDDITDLKIGDQVFAFVPGASYYRPDNGAFAEYSAVDPKRTFKVPAKLPHDDRQLIPLDPVDSLEASASFPCTLLTVAAGFEYYANIPLKYNPQYANQYFFVWGGASSLGQNAIQLAKFVGY
jgi:NADPH:quinone reductase-like Zn-dependent oxidoreductase